MCVFCSLPMYFDSFNSNVVLVEAHVTRASSLHHVTENAVMFSFLLCRHTHIIYANL